MEKRTFQAESKRLLDLVINSIYTNKEIFLREVISNASDAIDKVYYKALTDDTISFKKEDYHIRLTPDKEKRTLTISDTGIGMTEDELDKNLGVIAQSGSFDLKSSRDMEEDYDIIGQFGVGFYSVFMVADKVVVETRPLSGEHGWRWTSEGADGYTIEPCEKAQHGTDITLYLRANTEDDNFDEYIDPYVLRSLVRHYSNYIRYPIYMEVEKSRMVEETKDSETPDYETYREDEILNSMVPIWRRNKSELTEDDYNQFYRERHFGFDDPLITMHMNAEGTISYKAILYIPSQTPFDFYAKDYVRGLSLYANGVLIMDRCEELLPEYYGFVKGVVDSEDLTLNISRETLQQDRQLRLISRKIEERISKELHQLLENDRLKYESFFDTFGMQLKVGTYENYGQNKEKLQDFLLFYSSKEEKLVTLKEYLSRMPEDQPYIYYAAGDSIDKINRLPQVAIIKNHGFEILYLTESIDEFVVKAINTYQEKSFRSVSSDQLGLKARDKTLEDEQLVSSEDDTAVLDKIKEILGEEVVRVETTDHLQDDLVYLSTEGDISIEMEKVLNAMPNARKVTAKKVLEINKRHPVYAKLKDFLAEGNEDQLQAYSQLLYDQARLIAGLPLNDPLAFSKTISALM